MRRSIQTLVFPWLASLGCWLPFQVSAQSFLPPTLPWSGKSESIVLAPTDPLASPVEKSGFRTTPSYAETIAYLRQICPKGKPVQLQEYGMVGNQIAWCIATFPLSEAGKKLRPKPLLFIQAGIHSGEIDGKDAALLFCRDLNRGQYKNLLDKADLLIIPVLNISGHEMASPHNRPNQRGPENMGLRTNGENRNLNRDYMKLETKEIQLVQQLILKTKPDLYMDIHVTDGADYQYDITYGFVRKGHSPQIGSWLEKEFTPFVNRELENQGHIPGPFLNTTNGRDFTEGNSEYYYGPNFSHGYADLVHLPTVLVENHSLKPYKQRVLGTYMLYKAALELLGIQAEKLQVARQKDELRRETRVPYAFGVSKSAVPDTLLLKAVRSRIRKSELTGGELVEWLGVPEMQKVPMFRDEEAQAWLNRPKGYWIPPFATEVLEKLRLHGISLDPPLEKPQAMEVEVSRFSAPEYGKAPVEGRIRCKAGSNRELKMENLPAGSRFASTDQVRGDLLMFLMEPDAPESLFQWGFFLSVFQRTEYSEDYFLEPMAQQMLRESASLRAEWEAKKQSDPAILQQPGAVLNWFYERSLYYDSRYLKYPIFRVP